MKTLVITKHKTVMINILLDLYKDTTLSAILGFKGGTAAMLFYGLPRFSVDLDFDLVKPDPKNLKEVKIIFDKLTELLSKKYKITDQCLKFNTLFWAISYGNNLSHIKVEISTRDSSFNHYELIPFYGVSLKVMVAEDMIAHKLMTVMTRKSLANRDLFDVHYFLSSTYAADINYDLIKKETGEEPKVFFTQLLGFISTIKPNSVLSGLGEVLTESQKDWAKVKLIMELKGLIQRQIDLL
jgi:predicted nucleotidyltransferase component of viral defense system